MNILSPVPASVAERLPPLLDDMCALIPGALGAVLVTGDAMALARSGQLTEDQADLTAAATSPMLSLARAHFDRRPDPRGSVRQIMVQHDAGILLIMSAGARLGADGQSVATVLAVDATSQADVGQAGYQMTAFIQRLGSHLATVPRAVPG